MKMIWNRTSEIESKLLSEERERQNIERYELKRMGRWFIIPITGTSCYLIFAVYDLLTRWRFDLSLSLIAAIMAASALSVLKIQDDWERRLLANRLIYNDDINYPFNPYHYDEDLIYTDSWLKYHWYRISVAFAMVASLAMLIISILVVCDWLRRGVSS